MNEMIERVAKAFSDRSVEGCERPVVDGGLTACVGPCLCRELARAAIAAMREPTDEMARAAHAAMQEDSGVSDWRRDLWRAMIDAALRE